MLNPSAIRRITMDDVELHHLFQQPQLRHDVARLIHEEFWTHVPGASVEGMAERLTRADRADRVPLCRVAVHQGQAIGVRLLADVVDFARVRSADVLTLNTQAHNTSAQRLYEWFGFHRTGEQQTVLRYDLVPGA